MESTAFTTAVSGWDNFYLAVAGASAALLGLLFVGVSINLRDIATGERIDLRTRAAMAFANLVYVLVIALLMLAPNQDPHGIALGLGAIAILGLVRATRHLVVIARAGGRVVDRLESLRRIGWTLGAEVLLLYVAATMFGSPDPHQLALLMAVIFILLIGAADISWSMLVQVSHEAT